MREYGRNLHVRGALRSFRRPLGDHLNQKEGKRGFCNHEPDENGVCVRCGKPIPGFCNHDPDEAGICVKCGKIVTNYRPELRPPQEPADLQDEPTAEETVGVEDKPEEQYVDDLGPPDEELTKDRIWQEHVDEFFNNAPTPPSDQSDEDDGFEITRI